MPREGAKHADGILTTSLLEGSTDAFEELFARYFHRLTAYCRRIGGRDESEDLAQEALIRAWANLGRFETSRPMWPWLKAIASNLATDRARARGREIPLEPGHDEVSFDGKEERFEERALLSEAMRRLTPSQRTALRLRYLEDWDTAQVATFLGLSVPALKQLAYRARDQLRAEYSRLTEGSLAWALLSVRAIRRWIRIPVSRIQRSAAKVGSNLGLAGDGGYQLAAGVIGLTLVLGGWTPPQPSGRADQRLFTSAATDRAPAHSPSQSPRANETSARGETGPATSTSGVTQIEQGKQPKGATKADDAAQ